MIGMRPTPQQERWLTAARRFGIPGDDFRLAERNGGWKAPSLIARCAFFALGAVVGGLTFGVFELLYKPGATLLAGVILLAAAEWLIVRKRLFHAGVEEVLWCGGLAAVILHFVPTTGEVRMTLAAVLVFALAGVRLLNPLFVMLAAAVLSVSIDLAGGHRLLGEQDVAVAASIFCYGLGAIALLLAGRRFLRPSHDRTLSWLMIIMPICGFLWLASQHPVGTRLATGIASAVFAATALVLGIRRRTHAPLIAGMASLGCVASQLRDLSALPLELKLIVGGSGALLLAWAVERYLRTPREGITAQRIGEENTAFELLQLAGAGALSPAAPARADAPFKGGGGTFSGGGASDSY